jgi:hypothetical protein
VFADELDQLLRRPEVVAAVHELGVASLSLEDVLTALRSFGAVRVDIDQHPEQPYICRLAAGESSDHGRGRTVFHAAIACWAGVLEGCSDYTRQGIAEFEQFLLGPDAV